MMSQDVVRWGILGPGNIARDFFAATGGSETGRVVAVGSRNPHTGRLAEQFPGTTIHHGYDRLIDDPSVDAVYVALPHAFHAEWAAKAARRGKHVLCEKPMGLSAKEASSMFEASRQARTFLAEAFMYRLHPMTNMVLDLLRGGKVGELLMLRSNFGFSASNRSPTARLFDRSQGGGAILDLGCYPASIVRLLAGYRSDASAAEPASFTGLARFGETGVDVTASAIMTFPGDIVAETSCSLITRLDNLLQIIGTKGRLEIDNFWFATGKLGGTMEIRFVADGGHTEVIALEERRNLYSFEFEEANRLIAAGETRFRYPAMTEADSIGNAQLLDRWLAAVGYHDHDAAAGGG